MQFQVLKIKIQTKDFFLRRDISSGDKSQLLYLLICDFCHFLNKKYIVLGIPLRGLLRRFARVMYKE